MLTISLKDVYLCVLILINNMAILQLIRVLRSVHLFLHIMQITLLKHVSLSALVALMEHQTLEYANCH